MQQRLDDMSPGFRSGVIFGQNSAFACVRRAGLDARIPNAVHGAGRHARVSTIRHNRRLSVRASITGWGDTGRDRTLTVVTRGAVWHEGQGRRARGWPAGAAAAHPQSFAAVRCRHRAERHDTTDTTVCSFAVHIARYALRCALGAGMALSRDAVMRGGQPIAIIAEGRQSGSRRRTDPTAHAEAHGRSGRLRGRVLGTFDLSG